MAKDDTAFRGYRARMKGQKVLRETTSEHRCPQCEAEGARYEDGSPVTGLYTQVWVESDVKNRTLYSIEGSCPRGHDVQRYGYGEIPVPSKQKIIVGGVK